jgi:endonuclease/exonuclease/phosphatase family metal-dependent hydrolase
MASAWELALFLLLTIGVLAGLAAIWCAGGWKPPGKRLGRVRKQGSAAARASRHGDRLRLLTWNIAFGHGKGSDGRGFKRKPRAEILESLGRMAWHLRSEDVDVAFLQEVDFRCARTYGIDQLAYLAESSGLHYAAPAISWQANYVPFPPGSWRNHFGSVISGGGVLSRHPILSNEYYLMPKPRENPWWYNAFYPFRWFQAVRLEVNGEQHLAVNLHLEAFRPVNRAEQARQLARWLEKRMDPRGVLAVAGDFNAIPPEARAQGGFPDEPRARFGGDPTLDLVRRLSFLREAPGPEEYLRGEAQFWTFPADAPSRMLDHLFLGTHWRAQDARALQTGELSDHLPLLVEAVPARG